MPKTHKSLQSIRAFIEENEDIDQIQDQDGDMTPELEEAMWDEWTIAGASACPLEKTLETRDRYFKGIRWVGLSELLKRGVGVEFV